MNRQAAHPRRVLQPLALVALLASGCQGAAVTNPASPTSSAAASVATPSASATASASVSSPTAAATPSPTPPAVPAFAKLPTQKLAANRAAAMQQILEEAVHDGAPDVIAAIITPQGSWSGAAGVGGPDGRKATAEDEFAIASVTKTITATLVMRLAEEGKLDLDAPLSTYLGDIKADANGATVRQVLGMRSGLADFAPDSAAAIGADPAHHWTIEELLARFSTSVAKPGTAYSPSGPGFVLLGLAVEHVTGKPLAEALRSEVLDPVGAKRILQQGAGVATPKPWALPTPGHLGRFTVADLGAGGAISCISSASFSPGAGSMASDAPSLAAWTWHLFAGDIVDADSLTTMLPGADGHGLGLDALERPLDAAIGLTGGKTGYGTVLAVVPGTKTVAVVLVNDENFRIDRYISDLIDAAQGQ